jgi:hypothetical protein
MAALPTKKITQLDVVSLPLSGDEQFECVQTGNSRRLTARAFPLATDGFITVNDMGADLPNSRQLAAGDGIEFDDDGPANTLTISAAQGSYLPTELQEAATAAGDNNDFALDDDAGFLDLDTTAGVANLTGIVAPGNGHVVIISNVGASNLRLMTQDVGSAEANRFRLMDNFTILPNGSFTLRYSSSIGRWVAMS